LPNGQEVLRISPSELNSFLFCGSKWDFGKKNLPQLPTDDSKLLLGTSVHQAIGDYYTKIPSKPTLIEIENQAQKSFGDFVENTSHQKQKVERLLKNFIRVEQSRLKTFKVFKPSMIEKKIYFDVLVGIVDAYFQEDGICIDWKSGYAGDTLSNDYLRQGACYRMMLNKTGLPCNKVILAMLDNGRCFEVPQTSDSWVYAEIDKFKFGTVHPNPGNWCQNCQFSIRCQFEQLGVGLWDI